MKKIKKILLAFAPLAAIAVATPIVLTACSSTSNTTTPGGNDNGNNNGGSGDNNNENIVKPTFEADETNSKDFALKQDSEAQKIIENYKKAEGNEAATKVLEDALKGFPKKDSASLVTDVLNMWSNNNWFTITTSAKDNKVKETFVSNLNIKKAQVDATSGKASFDIEYKNAFTDSQNRTFEAAQVLQATDVTVDPNTPSIDITKVVPTNYKINGKDEPLSTTILLETSTDLVKNNFENVLKQDKITLDAKQVFQAYITNHGIQHAEKPATPNLNVPTWNETKVKAKKGLSIDTQDKNNVVLQLTKDANTDWGSINETHQLSVIKKSIENRKNEITNLIDLNDYQTPAFTFGTEIKNGDGKSHVVMTITFTKKANVNGNDTTPKLTFKINGFKSA